VEAAIAASPRIVWLSFAASVLSYRERVRAGKRIEIGPGAVKEVLGGPLSEQDYQDIAAPVLVLVLVLVQNGKVGGSEPSAASTQYLAAVRTTPHLCKAFSRAVSKLLGFTPCSEIVICALRCVAM
jgi:hypothetical protein